MVSDILILAMDGVYLIMVMAGTILFLDMAGGNLFMVTVIQIMVTVIQIMDIVKTIIILIIPADVVLHTPIGLMAIIDTLKVRPILQPEEQIILILEEVPPMVQPEIIPHL